MLSETPIVELSMAVPTPEAGIEVRDPLSLRLLPGECALIEAADHARLTGVADLFSGLVSLRSGTARFVGRDWNELPAEYAAALRGRIGRVFSTGAWLPFLDMEDNVLLPALHHTRRDREELRKEALVLAHEFGLPGLPRGHPLDVASADLDRAALVRAFLGEPLLVVVEDRARASLSSSPAVLNRLAATRDRGAAIIWLARERTIGDPGMLTVSQHLRLSDGGLVPMQRAA